MISADLPQLAPGSRIGILGGGQLGRMLATAAADLGFSVHIYCPEEGSPAQSVAADTTVACYTDRKTLAGFSRSVDIVTFETENIPVETVSVISRTGTFVLPGEKAIATAQDRLEEKRFLHRSGIGTAPFHAVNGPDSLEKGLEILGTPAILKTRRFGYDGKGQIPVPENEHPCADALWRNIGARPCILEGFVPFVREISVIGVRDRSGHVALYDPAENVHMDGILRTSTVPAGVCATTLDRARQITVRILKDLDYTGVIGVEFFVLEDGHVIVNEFAPRVHNSGHWTLDACAVSQFGQHIRAIAGWPAGSVSRHSDAVMHNLLGESIHDWYPLASSARTCIHIYGKKTARKGRKMGHYTQMTPLTRPQPRTAEHPGGILPDIT